MITKGLFGLLFSFFIISLVVFSNTPGEIPVQGKLLECYSRLENRGHEYYLCDFQVDNKVESVYYQRQAWKTMSDGVGGNYAVMLPNPAKKINLGIMLVSIMMLVVFGIVVFALAQGFNSKTLAPEIKFNSYNKGSKND